MTNCSFQIKNHTVKPNTKIIEIHKEGKIVGTIYPTEKGIKIVSRYFLEKVEEKIEIEKNKLPPIPAIFIKLQ